MAVVGTVVANLIANTAQFDQSMRRASQHMDNYGRAAERGFARAENAAKRYAGALKKAFATAGLAAGVAGESIGGGVGRATSAFGSIASQAALGGAAAGPWGAVAFGTMEGIKQLTEEINVRQKERLAIEEKIAAKMQAQRDHLTAIVSGSTATRNAIVGDAKEPTKHEQLAQMIADAKMLRAEFRPGVKGFEELFNPRMSLDERLSKQSAWGVMIENIRAVQGKMASEGLMAASKNFGLGVGRNAADVFAKFKAMGQSKFESFVSPVIGQGRSLVAGTLATQEQMRAQQEAIASRVQMLFGQDSGQRIPGVASIESLGLGSATFFQQMNTKDSPTMSLKELVKLATEQLATEKNQAADIGKEIAKQRVTVAGP